MTLEFRQMVLTETEDYGYLTQILFTGVFIGFKFIRGCMDRVLRNGFNETAVRTHRFQTVILALIVI